MPAGLLVSIVALWHNAETKILPWAFPSDVDGMLHVRTSKRFHERGFACNANLGVE